MLHHHHLLLLLLLHYCYSSSSSFPLHSTEADRSSSPQTLRPRVHTGRKRARGYFRKRISASSRCSSGILLRGCALTRARRSFRYDRRACIARRTRKAVAASRRRRERPERPRRENSRKLRATTRHEGVDPSCCTSPMLHAQYACPVDILGYPLHRQASRNVQVSAAGCAGTVSLSSEKNVQARNDLAEKSWGNVVEASSSSGSDDRKESDRY